MHCPKFVTDVHSHNIFHQILTNTSNYKNVYSSLLVNVTSASEEGNYFFTLGETPPDEAQNPWGGFGFIFVKQVGDKLAFGVSQNGSLSGRVAYSEPIYDLNIPHLLVLKYNQGPSFNDDWAELFIDPFMLGTEPAEGVKSPESGMEPFSNINTVNLLQFTGDDVGATYDIQVDAIRIATSWSALSDEADVETAPEIIYSKDGMTAKYLNFGTFNQGGDPMSATVNIKGTNLTSDITVSCQSEGYLNFSTQTIRKEDAQSENGFDLQITLDPKDGMVTNDHIRFAEGLISVDIVTDWS